LAEILLVDPKDPLIPENTVVAVDDYRSLVSEALHLGSDGKQSDTSGGVEAEVLVQVVIIKTGDRWFEDVCRGDRPGGDPPPVVLIKEGRFRLGAGQAELSGKGSS